MNQEQFTPNDQEDSDELKDTLSWIINVVFKVGAGYLAKVLIDAIGS